MKRIHKGKVHLYSVLLPISLALVMMAGCSRKGSDPNEVIRIIDGEAYFPMADGDTWYYNSGNFIRKVDGDTTVNGYSCKRILLGGETDQAWSLTGERFAQHLLDQGCWWFDPPLQIPLDLVKDVAYEFTAKGLLAEGCVSTAGVDSLVVSGKLTFAGYFSKEVNRVTLDGCLRIDYDYTTTVYFSPGSSETFPVKYSEYYAKGIGMIDDGDWVLNVALINGVLVPERP